VTPEPESEPEVLVIKEDKKRVPAGKEAAIEAEVHPIALDSFRKQHIGAITKSRGYCSLYAMLLSEN
jgi:hypothetical protein